MKRVKLGILGCGIAAREHHWPALKALEDKFEIVLLCNHTEEKAKVFSKMTGNVPYVTDAMDLFSHPEVEAVDIVLPIHLNYEMVKAALAAGKHVMVEKPLAASLKQAEELVELAGTYPYVTMVGENFRYYSTYLKVGEYLAKKRIGEPVSFFWNIFTHIKPENKYANTLWRIQHEYPGGFVTDGGIHVISAMRELFGEMKTGVARTSSVNSAIGEMDSMTLQVITQQGVHGVLNFCYSSMGVSEFRLVVICTAGSLEVDGDQITLRENGRDDHVEWVKGDRGYIGEFEDFYRGIRMGTRVKSDFMQAALDLRLLYQAYASAKLWDQLQPWD